MKQFLLIFCFAMIANFAVAQIGNESVNVFEDARIEYYMDKYEQQNRTVVQQQFVYRIMLTTSYERNQATSTQSKFRSLYPNESSFLNHDGVKYILKAGNFSSKNEAEVFLQSIRKNFPSAFVLPAERIH